MDNKIDELEYLMNPVMYHKWTTNVETQDKSTYSSDLKFYKKRIIPVSYTHLTLPTTPYV